MLGKDLAFRDLGLLIVDEEQRFGVAQKERLKEWKASIDVLVDVGDADPALAAPLALGPARPLDHRDAAARPARDRDAGRPVASPRSSARRSRRRSRAAARSSSCTTASSRSAASSRCSRSCCRRCASRSRTAQMPRGGAREGDAALLLARGRRAARDGDRRERPRHPLGQHDPDRPRRHLRPRAALPAARPRRAAATSRPTRTCWSTRRRRSRTSRAQRLASIQRVLRPRRRIPDRGARTSRSAARATSSAASSRATSRRSASRRTCRCSRRRSARSAARSAIPSAPSRSRSGLDLAIPHDYVEPTRTGG